MIKLNYRCLCAHGRMINMKFKKLKIEDKEILDQYISKHKFKTYEYSFTTLYLWRNMCGVEYAVVDDGLIIKKHQVGKGEYFMVPVGYDRDKLPEIINKLKDYKSKSYDMQNLFRDVEEDFLEEFKELFDGNIEYMEDIDNFDYIYETEKLISLSGKKYHSKKNHYNTFVSSYSYRVADMKEEGVAKDCIEFDRFWNENRNTSTAQLDYELDGTIDLIENRENLNIEGMAVYVEDKVVGFTIGEKINEDMVVIHIEKGDFNYKGVYAFINKTFLEKYFSKVKYVNREEDLGVVGLRKAKSSYHPVKYEKKFIVNIL